MCHYCTRIAVSAIKFLRITRESRNAVISLVNSVFIYRLRQTQNLNFKFTQLQPVTITLLISRLSNYYVPQNVFDWFRSISPFPECLNLYQCSVTWDKFYVFSVAKQNIHLVGSSPKELRHAGDYVGQENKPFVGDNNFPSISSFSGVLVFNSKQSDISSGNEALR